MRPQNRRTDHLDGSHVVWLVLVTILTAGIVAVLMGWVP